MWVTYSSNNSGGSWWLEDHHWRALEKAGWVVNWAESRYLGALAREALRESKSIDDAKAEWEHIVGMDPDATGCRCCGEPHWFRESYEDEIEAIKSIAKESK